MVSSSILTVLRCCRYVRVAPPVQNFNPIPIPLPFHDAIFPQMPRTQASLNYGHPLNPAMTAPSYTEWPSATMTYAQTLNASDVHHFRLTSLLETFFMFSVKRSSLSSLLHWQLCCLFLLGCRHPNPWPFGRIQHNVLYPNRFYWCSFRFSVLVANIGLFYRKTSLSFCYNILLLSSFSTKSKICKKNCCTMGRPVKVVARLE